MKAQLIDTFIQQFGGVADGVRTYHAPGRVNLIGEHVDYNGGAVFPAALTFGTTMVVRPRSDEFLNLATTNFKQSKLISLRGVVYDEADHWMNYPKGIVAELQQKFGEFSHGFDILYHGEIPNGAGLSSSASIEVVTAYALADFFQLSLNTVDIAILSQKSENEFNGVKCGIMDQFAVANGRRDHAILLHCDTLEYEHVPFETGPYKLVIGNTNKRRGLVDSKYNERRAQCDAAVEYLRHAFPQLQLLGQLTTDQFNEHEHVITDEVVRRRARHVVEEIARVQQSVHVLREGDLVSFGRLMNASHNSLSELYEVTGLELDAMVHAARSVEGVLGSRMTGAGFGGCTISIVHEAVVEHFIAQVTAQYKQKTGLDATFYVCTIGNGVERLQ